MHIRHIDRAIYMAEQLPTGKEGIWADSNKRQRSWLMAGGKILRWGPSQSMDDWHDPFHPKAREVIRCVSAALRGGGVSGRVLVGGETARSRISVTESEKFR